MNKPEFKLFSEQTIEFFRQIIHGLIGTIFQKKPIIKLYEGEKNPENLKRIN